MVAERLIVETDTAGNLIRLPKLPSNKRMEAIFIVLDEIATTARPRRYPHPDIAGKVQIFGDIIDSLPAQD